MDEPVKKKYSARGIIADYAIRCLYMVIIGLLSGLYNLPLADIRQNKQ
ncbi:MULTISPECIES: hypothetical protein [Morganella]